MSTWNQWWFSDGISPMMEEFIIFHDMVIMVMIFILIMVLWAFTFTVFNKWMNLYFIESQQIEWIWTISPAIVLLVVAIPSLSLLYMYDEHMNYSISMKAIGHQWYWSYEMLKMVESEVELLSFDSYIVPMSDLEEGGFRLLDTDTRVVAPMNSPIQMLVTSNDVLHSWALPALGVKVDAIPGRLNLLSIYSYQPGLFFGQCSEICGANHSFMPIVMEFIDIMDLLFWLVSMNND